MMRTMRRLPFPPPPLKVHADYRITGRADLAIQGYQVKGTDGPSGAIASPVLVPFLDETGKKRERDLAVAPVFSVILEPGTQVISTNEGSSKTVKVGVANNLTGVEKGILRLDVPAGSRVEPAKVPVEFHNRGEKQEFEFKIFPGNLKEGKFEARAVLESNAKRFSEGYSLVTREDLGAFYYYQPAVQRVSMVNVKIPTGMKGRLHHGSRRRHPDGTQTNRNGRYYSSGGKARNRGFVQIWNHRFRHSGL